MNSTPEELMDAYERNTANHDLQGILELIAPAAVYWFSDATTHVGKHAVEKALAANFSIISDESYRLEDLRWLARTSDLAACTYRFIWTGKIDGIHAGGTGRGTSVLERHGDSWLVLHEHLSTAEPAA